MRVLLIGAIVGLIAVFFFGCAGPLPEATPTATPVPIPNFELCAIVVNATKSATNIGYCDKIPGPPVCPAESKQACLLAFSIQLKNISICQTSELQGNPRNVCYIAAANYLDNISVCDNIHDSVFMAQRCSDSIVEPNTNSATCDSLGDYHKRSTCYQDVAYNTENISICFEPLVGDYQDACIYAFACAGMNRSLCENIQSDEWKNSCLAVMDLNSSKCTETIEDYSDSPRVCLARIAIKLNDSDACGTAPDENLFPVKYSNYLYCIQELAVYNSDIILCEKLPIYRELGRGNIVNPRFNCWLAVAAHEQMAGQMTKLLPSELPKRAQ